MGEKKQKRNPSSNDSSGVGDSKNQKSKRPRRDNNSNRSGGAKDQVALLSIPQLYQQCIEEGDDRIRQLEERGVTETVVVPYLMRGTKKKKEKKDDWKQACYLLAFFLTTAGTKYYDDDSNSVGHSQLNQVLPSVLETLLNPDQFETEDPVIVQMMNVLLGMSVVDKAVAATLSNCLLVGRPDLLFEHLPPRRLEYELKLSKDLRQEQQRRPKEKSSLSSAWLVRWLNRFLELVEGKSIHGSILFPISEDNGDDYIEEEDGGAMEETKNENQPNTFRRVKDFVHRSLELLIDLLSTSVVVVASGDSEETHVQEHHRRYLVTYLDSIHFVVRCEQVLNRKKGRRKVNQDHNTRLFRQLFQRMKQLLAFPVTVSGQAISKPDYVTLYHKRATVLQKLCHRHYPQDLPEVIYAGVGLLCNGTYLRRAMAGFNDDALRDILYRLRLIENTESNGSLDREMLMAILLHYTKIPPYPLDTLQSFPLYPTERLLWDHHLIPPGTGFAASPTASVLSVPKLGHTFLSLQDYLLRNFELIRLESAYEIRSDLVDVIRRIQPVARQSMTEEDAVVQTEFTGWARMALELSEPLKLVRIAPPRLGTSIPGQVVAEFTIDLVHCGRSIRDEWDDLGEFDNLFLVHIDATKMRDDETGMDLGGGNKPSRRSDVEDPTFPTRYGVCSVRGCMLSHVRDEDGAVLTDPSLQNEVTRTSREKNTKRIFRVFLDPCQYAMDAEAKLGSGSVGDYYESFNLIVRRHGRENNFKSVLETIRGLLDGSSHLNQALPSWLQPVLLGTGRDPSAGFYKSPIMKKFAKTTAGVAKPDAPLDFGDAFLSKRHLRLSFPSASKIIIDDKENETEEDDQQNHFLVKFEQDAGTKGEVVVATSSTAKHDKKRSGGNQVEFTPTQIDAIRAGLSPGLTLIVGPPGCGKTDIAVQIIVNLYQSYPSQRTVVITHSNAALNDIFEKVMVRGDIDGRYMIRLGAGERDLQVESLSDSSHDFTKWGRVAHSLARRGDLLEKTQQLSESLGISTKADRGEDGSSSYTCESAAYFMRHTVRKLMDKFERDLKGLEDPNVVGDIFPFQHFFATTPKLSLRGAREKLQELVTMFDELDEYRPLELLRSQRQRTDYLLMKQAKVVAMTCTHAAITRKYLVDLGFQYDNCVMEEAGQMMDAETFIPLLLQKGVVGQAASRLKRVCMIGDHNQLPPVVKNRTFANYSKLDRSLFTRLIENGVPFIQLDKQGRSRAEIASLYSWRYNNLGNLPHVLSEGSFQLANPGFAHTFQFINVNDFEGKGESSPTPYFYQNVGEAEYIVALFQYMVLIGYPPEKISILTTYNGQRALLNDILNQRCGPGAVLEGIRPRVVSTVDQYQGQQNEFVLLSLVRTESVGHLRDVRRLVVAVSRARLGLYVFGRQHLFEECQALNQSMNRFRGHPNKLRLVPGETFPTERKVAEDSSETFEVTDVTHLGSIVHGMLTQL